MARVISANEAADLVPNGSSIMCGGFLVCGAPTDIVDALCDRGVSDLHLVAICTDFADKGVGKLITNKQVNSVQTSHIGTNKSSQDQFNDGTLKVEFNPQGTFIERVRAGGAGLGGILTKTGVGTDLEKEPHRKVMDVNGEKYLLETAIKADFAMVRAYKADKMGNLIYAKTARNANPEMAMAGNITIAEVDELVETGDLDPEAIITPGICVDYIVLKKK